jgi:hypothetical protein
MQQGFKLQLLIFCELEAKIENILGYESEAQVGLFVEKAEVKTFRATIPLKKQNYS